MTTIRAVLGAVALSAVLAGCSKDEPTKIGCSWFAGDNCWKETAAAALLCTDAAADGTFNVETTSCGYGDGTVVTFAAAADATLASSGPWDFTVAGASGTCMGFHETESAKRVTTSLGTYREDYSGASMVITCPGGAEYEIGVMDALGCDWATLPGYAVSGSGGWITFSLLGTGQAEPELWSCMPAP